LSRSTSRALDISQPVARRILEKIDTPYSLRLLSVLCKSHSDFIQIAPPDPSDYINRPYGFRRDYLASQLLSKYDGFLLPFVDRKKVALDKFLRSEERCSLVNSALTFRYWERNFTPSAVQVFRLAQRKIAKVLGPFSWDEAENHFGFGPGACIGLPRLRGDAYHKLRVKPSTTMECLMSSYCAVMRVPLWAESVFLQASSQLDLTHEQMALQSFDVVRGNRIVTVPKSAKTDRVIAIEPLMNVYIQMGIGRCIRHRLLRVGIDLRSQEVNQMLALEGSVNGTLATIDLSSASDSISLKLVERLLPEDWVSALKQCRSPRGTLPDGTSLTYHKVSSMGNGYTFDLETLIFWAFTSACREITNTTRFPVAVYGDDIVAPAGCADLLIQVLKEFGFDTNSDKTFVTGQFRESCGKHYFSGLDVTPFYIRHSIASDLSKFTLANNLRRWTYRPHAHCCDSNFKLVHDFIIESSSRKSRNLRIPDGFGDIGFVSNFDESTPTWNRELQCFSFKALLSLSRGDIVNDASFLLKCLYDLERNRGKTEMDSPRVVPRKSKYVPGQVHTTQWRDFGPWL